MCSTQKLRLVVLSGGIVWVGKTLEAIAQLHEFVFFATSLGKRWQRTW
jgi:hypothetical protein